ncbi:MAG TPA: hypothetical protein VIX62_04985 [Actinomycetota bacterium]
MNWSPFTKGAAVGAASVIVLIFMGLGVLAAVWIAAAGDEPPDPTATRHEAVGVVTTTEPRLCVEGTEPAQEGTPTPAWCGLAQPGYVAPNIAVGDAVVGAIIYVETDPGSGTAFSVWESLTPE